MASLTKWMVGGQLDQVKMWSYKNFAITIVVFVHKVSLSSLSGIISGN